MMRTSRQKRQAGSRTFKRVAKLEDCPELQRPVVYVNTDIVWERGDVGLLEPALGRAGTNPAPMPAPCAAAGRLHP
jgi:hypothetical protein